MNYVLIEVVERDISTPEFFDTFEDAHAEMEQRYNDTFRSGVNGELNEWDAWCESANHDNCDWRIFEI